MGTTSANQRYHDKHRHAVIEALGPICVRCGFTDLRALQIDHTNGGGGAERKLFGAGTSYYRQMLSHIHDYQILCANCNWIKKHELREARPRTG